MPSSTKRQRELARLKWEKRQRQMAEAKVRRRRRQKIIASALSVILVAALGVWVASLVDDDESGQQPIDASNPPVACTYRTVEGVDTGGRTVGPPPSTAATEDAYHATVTTNQGVIEMDLDAAAAPCTVNSFVHLAQSGFYDATTCHRMLATETSGLLQCGDPTGTGGGGPGYQFDDENLEGAQYTAGTLAMANSGASTNGSQFFMVYSDTQLDGPKYTPFGRITAGLDILQGIADGGVDGETPKTNVEIQSVTITSV